MLALPSWYVTFCILTSHFENVRFRQSRTSFASMHLDFPTVEGGVFYLASWGGKQRCVEELAWLDVLFLVSLQYIHELLEIENTLFYKLKGTGCVFSGWRMSASTSHHVMKLLCLWNPLVDTD